MAAAQRRPRSVVCTVPHLPPKELNPNKGLHWKRLGKAKAAAKDELVALLIEQGCVQDPLWERAHLKVTFVAADKRRRDLDNLIAACKPWIDGLVGVNGVIVDDAADRLSIEPSYRIGENEQTILEVTYVP